jgi:hypothetical protein
MTTKELMERLEKYPPNAPIKVYDNVLQKWVTMNITRITLGEVLLSNVGGTKV